MFSEWTASRAAGKRLEDVIRKQWAVPSTHNPPMWGCASMCAQLDAISGIHFPDAAVTGKDLTYFGPQMKSK